MSKKDGRPQTTRWVLGGFCEVFAGTGTFRLRCINTEYHLGSLSSLFQDPDVLVSLEWKCGRVYPPSQVVPAGWSWALTVVQAAHKRVLDRRAVDCRRCPK